MKKLSIIIFLYFVCPFSAYNSVVGYFPRHRYWSVLHDSILILNYFQPGNIPYRRYPFTSFPSKSYKISGGKENRFVCPRTQDKYNHYSTQYENNKRSIFHSGQVYKYFFFIVLHVDKSKLDLILKVPKCLDFHNS